MEAVILIGLQGSGKSTFYKQHFANTHAHISLDVLKTRKQEKAAIESAIERNQDFVIDNTNPTVRERAEYISAAKAAGYKVLGYYFDCSVQDCLKRNQLRAGRARIPPVGLFATRKRLQIPAKNEGFEGLFIVRADEQDRFKVAPFPEDFQPLAFQRG